MGMTLKPRRGEPLDLNWTWFGWLMEAVSEAGGEIGLLESHASSGSDYLRAHHARSWADALERSASDLYEVWVAAKGYTDGVKPTVVRKDRLLRMKRPSRVRPVHENELFRAFLEMCRDGSGIWFWQ